MSQAYAQIIVQTLDQELGEHKGTTGWLQWPCPFCQSRIGTQSSKPHLRVNPENGAAKCYRCNFAAGSGAYLLKSIARETGVEIDVSGLADIGHEGVEGADSLYASVLARLYPPNIRDAEKKRMKLPANMVPIQECHRSVYTRRALLYLEKRKVTVKEAARFEIGFCPTGEFAQRLIFPIRMFGHVVYFTNRYVGDTTMKTKNPKNRPGYYKATDCLGNYDRAISAKRVYILEGPFDGLSRPKDGVFTMGKTISENQIALLEYAQEERGVEEFVIMRDADADGYDTYQKCAGRLRNVTQIDLDHGDPFSRRRSLKKFIEQRHEPTVFDSILRKLAVFTV